MDDNRKETEKINEQEIQELPKFDFMREKIKERPINKKKLLRRTVLTAAMAVIFGLVACLTVLVLEPVFSNWLYPEEPAEKIEFPPETQEILPEDMVLDDTGLEKEDETEMIPVPKETDPLETYQKAYQRLQDLTDEVSRCLVTVTGVTSDIDWFDNTYESRDQATGVIIGSNGREYLILTEAAEVSSVETIKITFHDDTQVQAQVKMTDPVTGLAVLAVENKRIGKSTLDKIDKADFGGSNYASLTGSPVIAMGSPAGVRDSVIYGVATSCGNVLHTVDSRYKLITTDIYGSENSTGVLVNLQGQIIGIINQSYNSAEMKNMIAALGISELKDTIERLSNGKEQAYLGIYGADVTEDAHQNLQVPHGAYVTEIAMDSPAMLAGVQSGDVIVSLNGRTVENYTEYIEALGNSSPDTTVNITLMRKTQDEYKTMSFQVTLGALEALR